MTQLQQLIENVREENLSKDVLEQYHTEITYLDNLMRMESAPIEKEQAIYFSRWKENFPDMADVEIKRKWQVEKSGQRQIELNHYLKVTPKLLQSLKTRLYSQY